MKKNQIVKTIVTFLRRFKNWLGAEGFTKLPTNML
jgi:hypothetical protein